MQNIKEIALSKFKPSKNSRDSVEPGEYEVDMTVRVKGSVRVGEDYEQVVSMSIPYRQLLAVVVKSFNQNPDKIVSAMESMSEDDLKVAMAEADEFLVSRMGNTRAAATKTCKGKVTSKLDFTF